VTWVDAVIQGILLGGLYALFACGLSLMFGVMRIINLAHGDVAVLGAYLTFVVVERTGQSAFVAFAVALPVMLLLGSVLQVTVLERSFKAGVLTTLLATVGLWSFLRKWMIWQSRPARSVTLLSLRKSWVTWIRLAVTNCGQRRYIVKQGHWKTLPSI